MNWSDTLAITFVKGITRAAKGTSLVKLPKPSHVILALAPSPVPTRGV